MSDYVRSIVRTVLPGVWAVLVLQLVKLGLPDTAAAWLSSSEVVEHVTNLVALAAVYGFVRYIEPVMPDWLTRLLLGSAKAPTYSAPSAVLVEHGRVMEDWRRSFDDWKRAAPAPPE